MGGKARWRKLQRVVGSLPQGPHASVDKHRQRRERARTRDAKRRRLGENGEENADTILIGSKKEINKEDEEHKACENKNENDKEADKPYLEQEKKLEDKIKTEISDTDNSSCSEEKVQEAMEQRAGVWTASPNGWVFRPLSDTTLEDELRKAQEEEDENGKRDRIHENGQRVAKFFLSDDESDSDTAIFIDAYQPVASEDKDSQSSEAPVTSPCHSEALQRDGLLENSSGFLVHSQVQVPLEAEDVELVLANAIEEDEISETVDPLAKISTMEAVVTDCTRQDSQMAVLPSRFLEAETAPDQTSTDTSIESAANSVNKQLPCPNKTDATTSSGSTKDRDCIKSESADGQVGVSTMKKEVGREADAAQDTLHQEADTESHSTHDTPTSKEQVQLAMITEATIENSSLPKPDSGKEVVDANDTRGDSDAENLFFSLYPEYHQSEPEENDSRSSCDVAQDIEDSVDVASLKVDDQDGQEHPKDFQEICDASQTANLAQDSSSDDSPTSGVDPVATSTPEIVPRTILHKSDSLHRDLHQLESSASCQEGLEEAGAEAGQDALELESRLESERARQTLVGKAREWIKGVARMGATKRVDSYGNQPILEATEDTCSHSVGETDDDNEVFTVPADTLEGNSTEVLAVLESSEDVKVFDMPKEDQQACFTPDEDVNDIPESGTNLSTQQTPQGNASLQSSSTWDSWRCSPPDRGVLEDDARVQDARESSTLDIHTKATAEVSEDLNFDEEGSHSTGEDWNPTQQNITQLSPGVGDVIDHYPPEEKVHYSSPANEEQDYFTPGIDVEDNLKAIHDGNIYLQQPTTLTLQACYPLPDPVVFPSTFEDSYDGPTPTDYHTPYPEPMHDSGLHETPDEEVSTPYTPVEELKIICSSVELLQAQYTHEKGSEIHDLLAQKLQTHHTPEDESIIHDSPAKEQEAYNTPDSKDIEQNYTPANMETCYTFTEEYSSYHTPAEKQGTCMYIGGMNYDNTPTKGSTTYKPAEEKDGDYILKGEEEEAQLSHYTPAEEQENLNTPEREESVHHYVHVEGEKCQQVSEEEEEKGYHTPTEEHWPHYTPADEQYTSCTPTDEINGFSTSAEDGEAIHTPVNEPNAYYETAEEDIVHCEPDEESFARDEEQESHNTPHITQNTDKEAATESNVINETTEAHLRHSTSDNKLSTPAEGDEDAHTPCNDYNTPDTCAPDEGVTLDTRDTDLESHYIPDSHLETREEEIEEKEEEEEEEEKENEEKGENIAEKRVEDEDNKNEEGREDYFEMNMNRERTDSERGEKDSEGEGKNDGEKEERKKKGREGRKDSEREERADSRGEERDSGGEGRKDSEKEGRRNSEKGRKDSEGEMRESGGEGGKDSHREERKEGEGEERKNSERNERKDSDKERKDNENEGRKENERKERKDSEREEKEEDREKEREDSEKEEKKEDRMKERKDSEREEMEEDRMKERKDSEREEMEEDRRKERKDSEREEKEEDRRKERKDSEREEMEEDRRKEREDSEREEKEEDRRKERKDSEREGKEEDRRKERKDSEREGKEEDRRKERKDSEREEMEEDRRKERKDSEREGKEEDRRKERKDSEREGKEKDRRKERKDSEREGKEEDRRRERKDSEREGKEEDRRKERKDSEREEMEEDRRKERKDSEREEKEEDRRKERKDSEREEMEEDRRKERKDSEREEKEEDRRKERKDSEREGKEEDRRKERKDSEKEEMVDIEREDNIEREEKEVSVKERRRNNGEERRGVAEMEKRRPSDWEWRKNSESEERRNSDWEKRRNERKRKESEEGKKQSETEGSTEEHTAAQAASAMGEAAGVLGDPVTSGPESAAATLDSHTASEDVATSRLTVLSNPSEGVISDHTDVPQRGFRGGREKNNRDFKSHQKHGKARHQHTSTDDGDTGGKASVRDEYAEDAKREDKSANKRRRNRRNKGKCHGEQETGIPHPQSATGRDWTSSRSAEAKFFSHGGSWEMEVSHERDIHYHNKEYHSQRQESCSPRENLENSGTSAFFQKPTVPHQGDIVATSGSCKRSNKNVPYQKKQQANHKDKFSECQRESYRRVERFSEEQKADGAGEFAVPGSLGSPGSMGSQNGERRRNRGNEKGSRRCEYGEDILQEKFALGGGESVEKPPPAKVWSPRIERKDKKDSRKERRERKVFDKYGEELKKGVSGTPERGSASHSRPPLLETPVEGVTPSGAQKREVKPSSGSLLGSPPPPPPSSTTTKLRYPEALSQPLSPPPSPPLNRAREMKEKTKPSSGEMEKIKEAYLTSDPPSYARKAASQSVMYTIPETAPASPQQTEKGAPNPQSSKLSQDRPQCTPKSSSHKDTSEHQAPDQTKSPVSHEGKQTRGSSCKSPPPPSCHASQSPKQQSTSSSVDPQTSHEELTSASHSSFPPLASPPPSQQESLRDFIGTPISRSPMKLKPEIDTSQKTDAAEEEATSTGKPKAGSEKPPGSPGRLSVAQRMKFPELQISAIETKAEESHADEVSRKPDIPQASSTMAAKLSAGSKEDDAGSVSPRHASPSARTISTQKIVSKLPRGSEASPRAPSPSHLTSSSSSCTDKTESDALQISDKPLQETASSPRPQQSDIEFAASESLSDSKSCEEGPSEPQSPSQLAKEDWTASEPKQTQQGHSSSQECIPQKEGSMPRSRDTKVMKKKRRR